ncbi:MAG: NAD(P)-binding protein [Gemmataceae bacterium]|nr:NAD(P)-binding protein [Gemmataceae bacterium]MDW8264311.1 NAD(P)-binding protein [Gemmataceae bacterium]
MPIRISNLRLGLDEPEEALAGHLARALGLRPDEMVRWRILRKSLDARDRRDLHFVYTAEVCLAAGEEARVVSRYPAGCAVHAELFEEPPFVMPPPGTTPLEHRPVVVGSGPAGLVAAYFLAVHGYQPLVLERGRPVRERIRDVRAFDAGGPLDPESNYLFGEGGAGTFSDGKLTCRSSGPDVRRVLELFADCKGKPSILYDHRPHLGSNRLPAVVKAIRQRIEAAGGEVRFQCRVEDLDLADGGLRGLVTSSGYIRAEVALLAIGHSARDTYAMLVRRGLPLVPKPFQMGVRIEQPQETVNRVVYGSERWERQLGAADYALVARGRHDLFTFCMCAGGYVIPSVSEPGYFCTNGMSLSGRDSPFANSGLVVTVPPEAFEGDDVLAGVRLQQRYEQRAFEVGRGEYRCPIQWARDFLVDRPTRGQLPSSYRRGVVPAEIAGLVPPLIVEALRHGLPILDRRWQGRFLADATLVGPEARGSSPVRILRDAQTRETPGCRGIYPVGEGAGYAGGIVSAAVDGLRSAKAVIARYAPLRRP